MVHRAEDIDEILKSCKKIFLLKNNEYGATWLSMRITTLTDLIFIKLRKIRSFQEKKIKLVSEDVSEDIYSAINYTIMALIRAKINSEKKCNEEISVELEYDQAISDILSLFQKKNHDYDESWKIIRPESILDIMIVKVMRIKQMEDFPDTQRVSEGVSSNYMDIIIYAAFFHIRSCM